MRRRAVAAGLVVIAAGGAGCAGRDELLPCDGVACGLGGAGGDGPVPCAGSACGGGGGAGGLAVAERVEGLVGALTLDEKLRLVGGTGFDTHAVPRLGIPALRMTDGPLGIRDGQATAWPAGAAMAATFDPELAERWGAALGREAKARGKNVLLGPCVNIQRVPQGGRSFEGFGEDPYLAARLAVGVIRGVQSEGVVATVKHFAANNQETERFTISAEVDPRTLHEIYFPAFEAAVTEAGVQAVMCAYNRVNGIYACEQPYLLADTLRGRWGFEGLVMSDWGATHSVVPAVRAGLDLEMPTPEHLSVEALAAALDAGDLALADLDAMVRRILGVMARMGTLDAPLDAGALDTPEHRALNREAARSSFVLLQNEGAALPLDAGALDRLLVVGPLADSVEAGGGSSLVAPTREITLLAALRARHPGLVIDQDPGAAAAADAALVFVGHTASIETEGVDRATLDLPAEQVALVRQVAAAAPRTIVLLGVGAPVLLGDFLEEVPAVLLTWFGGQELGDALVDVLFGEAGPSGRLPVTFPRRWEDCPAFGAYPGEGGVVDYAEGLLVGYRGFDTRGIEPLFPFGHGLGYTAFEYDGLELGDPAAPAGLTVAVTVTNVGERAGVAVPQVYVHDVAASLPRPEQGLAAFTRVELGPGESRRVELVVAPRSLAFFDPGTDGWVREPGAFEVRVGESSRDLRLRATVELE